MNNNQDNLNNNPQIPNTNAQNPNTMPTLNSPNGYNQNIVCLINPYAYYSILAKDKAVIDKAYVIYL